MIPARLSLRNFMCYGDHVPSLNFDNFHIACLTGNNGHGKSALLDAMTWALWGKSRAQSQDELVHQGQREMSVDFEFEVPPQRFRIIRQYTRQPSKNTGHTSLDLFANSGGQYTPVSSGVKATEDKLMGLIKLDYDTFINSAFLRQGRADEFTRSQPAKRKAVLANILNLSFYDQLVEKAKEKRNSRNTRAIEVQSLLERNNKELEKNPAYLLEGERLDLELQKAEKDYGLAKAELEKIREHKQRLELKESQARQTEANLNSLQKDEKIWHNSAEKHRDEIAGLIQLINRKEEIENSYKSYVLSKEEEKSLSEKFEQLTLLREKRTQIDRVLKQEENQLRIRHADLSRTVRELENKIKVKTALITRQEELIKLADAIKKQAEEVEHKKREKEILSLQISTLQADQKRLSDALEDLNKKRGMLGQENETCPLCGSTLGQDGLMQVKEHYQEEIGTAEKSLKQIAADLNAVSAKIKFLDTAAGEKDLDIKKQRHHREDGLWQKTFEEVKAAEAEMPRQNTSLEKLTVQIDKGDYAPEQRVSMAAIDADIKRLGYDDGRHKEIKKQIAILEKSQKEKFLLDEAVKRLDSEREEEKQALASLSEKKKQIELEQSHLEEQKKELTDLPEVRAKSETLEATIKSKEQERNNLFLQRGDIQARINRCLEMDKENMRLQEENLAVLHEIGMYDSLMMSFGKRGVQALIIDNSLPEINIEANELLSRLTDNRMTLKLEMRKDSPGGVVTEALDIRIADEYDTRNYEMFSGGEAFRIDFAIRIALSRFLARRSGAPLSLLIVDEGFGSQDQMGKDRLIQALNYIRNDFDKILVITHLPELKEFFPYRINVIKTDEGSTIQQEEV